MAATLKLLPLFTLVMPGMAARVLFKNEVGTYVYSLPIMGLKYSRLIYENNLFSITSSRFRSDVRTQKNVKAFAKLKAVAAIKPTYYSC